MPETSVYTLASTEKPPRSSGLESILAVGVSASGIRTAFVVAAAKRPLVVIDGTRGPEFDQVLALAADPTGRRFSYVGRDGKHQVASIDGKLSKPVDEVTALAFTADGKRVMHVERTKQGDAVVVDGEVRGTHHYVYPPQWSPDGKHLAYAANTGGKIGKYDCEGGTWSLVVDDKPGPSFAKIHRVEYAPDGKLLCVVNDGAKEHVARDGVPGPSFQSINGVVGLVTRGSRVAYWANEDGKPLVVLDGEPQPRGDYVSGLVFSRDGNRFVYVIDDTVVIDGKREPKHGRVSSVVLGGDAGRVAYLADNGNARTVYVDGEAWPSFTTRASTELVFSHDGKRLAYVGNDGDKLVGYLDGKPLPGDYDNIGVVSFSPDGRRFAYRVVRGGKYQWVVDGTSEAPHEVTFATHTYFADGGYSRHARRSTGVPAGETTSPMLWTPDSAHHAYLAKVGKSVVVYIDGKLVGIKVDEMLAFGWLPRERCFAGLARRKGDYLLIRTDAY